MEESDDEVRAEMVIETSDSDSSEEFYRYEERRRSAALSRQLGKLIHALEYHTYTFFLKKYRCRNKDCYGKGVIWRHMHECQSRGRCDYGVRCEFGWIMARHWFECGLETCDICGPHGSYHRLAFEIRQFYLEIVDESSRPFAKIIKLLTNRTDDAKPKITLVTKRRRKRESNKDSKGNVEARESSVNNDSSCLYRCPPSSAQKTSSTCSEISSSK
ncbi:hypothetical protein Q1695_014825 [Nippostrongylus brasiliensis]|nr:hypothetical protein Q1695_014825 [Nippostrongylus brasiliensis]